MSLRFSQKLLIFAILTWLLCLGIELIGFGSDRFSGHLSGHRNAIALLCFLFAVLFAFVAGSVYGMEAEFELSSAAHLSSLDDAEEGNSRLAPYTDSATVYGSDSANTSVENEKSAATQEQYFGAPKHDVVIEFIGDAMVRCTDYVHTYTHIAAVDMRSQAMLFTIATPVARPTSPPSNPRHAFELSAEPKAE